MTWSIYQNPDRPYVECIFKGTISWQDIKDATAECIAIQREQNITKFLIETSEMQPTATLTDVFELPASEYRIQNVDRQTRIAVVYAPSGTSEEIVKFYETACTNRGWKAKSFTSRKQATDWLAGKQHYK